MKIKKLYPYYILVFVIVFLCRNNIFFWDTYQLGAKQAWALFENGIFNWHLPAEIDSGHPPVFGMYLASLWKIFGPSLPVSHFAMLPFLFGIVFLLYKLASLILDAKFAHFLIILLLVDPIFIGQGVLVSPDIPLVFFFLLLLLGIFQSSNNYKLFAAIGLGLISTRGMMVLAALILFDFLKDLDIKKSIREFRKYLVYIPALVTILFFILIHYSQTGWIGYHEDSEWAGAFQKTNFREFLRNIGIYIWRFLDFGRVALCIALVFLFFKIEKIKAYHILVKLILLICLLDLIIAPVLIIHKGLLLHRYLLPITCSLSILFWYMLYSSKYQKGTKNLIFALVSVSLLMGNLWVYPRKISQGWDSTLAHVPYYSLRAKMIEYIEKENIPLSIVGTAFPNIGPMKNFDPANKESGFPKMNFDVHEYIFYSNVYNDFSDQQLYDLEHHWEVIKSYGSLTVEVILYKKPL